MPRKRWFWTVDRMVNVIAVPDRVEAARHPHVLGRRDPRFQPDELLHLLAADLDVAAVLNGHHIRATIERSVEAPEDLEQASVEQGRLRVACHRGGEALAEVVEAGQLGIHFGEQLPLPERVRRGLD